MTESHNARGHRRRRSRTTALVAAAVAAVGIALTGWFVVDRNVGDSQAPASSSAQIHPNPEATPTTQQRVELTRGHGPGAARDEQLKQVTKNLVDYYAAELGVSAADAQCVAHHVVEPQGGPTPVRAPTLATAMKACGLSDKNLLEGREVAGGEPTR